MILGQDKSCGENKSGFNEDKSGEKNKDRNEESV